MASPGASNGDDSSSSPPSGQAGSSAQQSNQDPRDSSDRSRWFGRRLRYATETLPQNGHGEDLIPRKLLWWTTMFLCFGILAGLGTFFGITIPKDNQPRTLEEDRLTHDNNQNLTIAYNKAGTLRGKVVGGGDFERLLDDGDDLVEYLRFWATPILAFLFSKIITMVLHEYTEIRYDSTPGVPLSRLLLTKICSVFGDRMRDCSLRWQPQLRVFWERIKNSFHGGGGEVQEIQDQNALGVDENRNPIHNAGGRVFPNMCATIAIGALYSIVVFGVDLIANFGSQGIEKDVNPFGKEAQYTLEVSPTYKPLTDGDPIKFIGLRKCSQFNINVRGVIGSNGFANSLMSCGTYFEPILRPGPSEDDGRGGCTFPGNRLKDGCFNGNRACHIGDVNVFLGKSLCDKSDESTTTLSITFQGIDYDGPNEKTRGKLKPVGTSLTSNPFASKVEEDPQVSFVANATVLEDLARSMDALVKNFNSGNENGARTDKKMSFLKQIGQIPDTDLIELTEAIAQNIFFHSQYNFKQQSETFCQERESECLDVVLGRTRTRRGFLWGAIVATTVALVAKFVSWCATGSLYVREISPIFEDALFASLHERSGAGYLGTFNEEGSVRVRRNFAYAENVPGIRYVVYEAGHGPEVINYKPADDLFPGGIVR